MTNKSRYDFVRQAIAKSLILAVWLAGAWMPAGAIAQPACDRLNYDESKVGDYTVPDPLLSKDGKRVDATSWRANRARSASATTDDESRPPDTVAPTGTSETSCSSTARSSSCRNRPMPDSCAGCAGGPPIRSSGVTRSSRPSQHAQ